MNSYWIKFTDGTSACCQGETAYDARKIAEKLANKEVEGPKWEAGPNVQTLPYPASPCVWRFEHPIHGRTPTFCHAPEQCKGRSSCPQRYSCVE